MTQELALAVRLQALDRKIASLELEIATLPKQVAEIERKLEAHKRRLEASHAAMAANQRERKKLEGDIQGHNQKASKLRDQMLLAKTNDQYRAFQHEIDWCETEIRRCEDQIIELMEASEPVEKAAGAAEAALKREAAVVEQEKARATERTAKDKQELAQMQAERKEIVAGMSPKVYSEYERIRKKTKGTVIADASEGRCDACMIALRPQFFQDLRRGEEIMLCESCGRMLTYNPPVAFDHGAGPAATTA